MDQKKTLQERCHVDSNDDGDCFVGVKADSDDAIVYFPLGYSLPSGDQELRRDIQRLFRILAVYTTKEDKLLHLQKNEAPQTVNFPIQAYLTIINFYIDNGGYYTEREAKYETNTRGKTDWSRTIKQQTPLVQNNSLIYLKQVVRVSSPNDKNLITQINKFCVYESYQKLGWLFGTTMPEQPTIKLDKTRFISLLNDKLSNVNNTRVKGLFKAMIAMIKYLDEHTLDKQFFFGTERFEYVWQAMIDKVFGINGKEGYFPRAKWKARFGKDKGVEKHPLEPDSIMIVGDKYYVLDAKYYQYGTTGSLDDLPNSSDINKQFTYGDFVRKKAALGDDALFNAFIMPFNKNDNLFGTGDWHINVAEATGDWRPSSAKKYEKVQGILVDVRYLMFRLDGNHDAERAQLASEIEKGFAD